jgi:hypothetical protein
MSLSASQAESEGRRIPGSQLQGISAPERVL